MIKSLQYPIVSGHKLLIGFIFYFVSISSFVSDGQTKGSVILIALCSSHNTEDPLGLSMLKREGESLSRGLGSEVMFEGSEMISSE